MPFTPLEFGRDWLEGVWVVFYIWRRVAGIAQLVEHNLAKVGVAGSSPVSRSGLRRTGAALPLPFRVGGVGVPGWRKGRRGGLKIPFPQGSVGSIPAPGMDLRISPPRAVTWHATRRRRNRYRDRDRKTSHSRSPPVRIDRTSSTRGGHPRGRAAGPRPLAKGHPGAPARRTYAASHAQYSDRCRAPAQAAWCASNARKVRVDVPDASRDLRRDLLELTVAYGACNPRSLSTLCLRRS